MGKKEGSIQEAQQRQEEEARLYQAIILNRHRATDEWKILSNLMKAIQKLAVIERRSAIKKQATRETVMYFDGVQDGIEQVFEKIAETIAEGDSIRASREFQALYEEGA